MSEIVVTRPRPGVTRVAMNRPERLNAMTAGMIEGLHAALAEAAADPECRVVVLTGAGRGFCAGLDLGGYGEPAGVDGAGAVQRGLAT
ncbi:enoyl-CoA hydratase-related protein, partial [Actinomadura sp. NPDC048394]|uniref:enoyl-CoA hydratase/isomerase family protein n=1 Tax=Actinomadura sp. NPDC048394 TaxID=3158223 RepID=UPI0033FC64A5